MFAVFAAMFTLGVVTTLAGLTAAVWIGRREW